MTGGASQARRRRAKKKRRAWRFGHVAETLVARRGRTVAMIEVKARDTFATAAEALGRHQQRRIVRAAAAFLKARPGCAGLDVRFDMMVVLPWRLPVHLTDAWRSEG